MLLKEEGEGGEGTGDNGMALRREVKKTGGLF